MSFGASYQRDERDGVMWAQLPYWFTDGTRTDWPRSKTTGTDWGHWNTTEISAFATLTHELGGGWNIRGDLGYHKGLEEFEAVVARRHAGPGDRAGVNSAGYWYKADPEQWHGSIQANGTFALLGGTHDLSFGAMASYLDDGWTNRDPVAIDPSATSIAGTARSPSPNGALVTRCPAAATPPRRRFMARRGSACSTG